MRHKQVAGTHLQAARGRPIRYKLPDSRRAEFRQEAQTSFPSSYGRYVSLLLFKPEAPMTENSLYQTSDLPKRICRAPVGPPASIWHYLQRDSFWPCAPSCRSNLANALNSLAPCPARQPIAPVLIETLTQAYR